MEEGGRKGQQPSPSGFAVALRQKSAAKPDRLDFFCDIPKVLTEAPPTISTEDFITLLS